METEKEQTPADVIVAALRLAKERVTGEPQEKERRREELADMINKVQMHDVITLVPRPTADELKEILGDPDDGKLRKAIAAWG
jgi:hypothetical protein